MTYINLTRHDARLGGDLRLRLAWRLRNVSTWWTTSRSVPYLEFQIYKQIFRIYQETLLFLPCMNWCFLYLLQYSL